MSFRRKQQPEDLGEWLGMATGKLVVSARERIGLEIETHYDQAVASRLEAGDPEREARTRALAELGDPRAAARRFRRRHLTESEAKQIKKMFWSPRRDAFLVVCYVIFAACQCGILFDTGLSSFRFPRLLACAAFVSLILLPTAGVILARRKYSNSNLLLLYWMQPTDAIFTFVFFRVVCERHTDLRNVAEFAFCLAVYYLVRLPLWNKLRRMPALGDELPAGTVSS